MSDSLPQSLFRYFTTDGVLATLRHGTLRFACPLDFNDRNDNQWDANYQLNTDEFRTIFQQEIEHLVESDESLDCVKLPELRLALQRLRSAPSDNRAESYQHLHPFKNSASDFMLQLKAIQISLRALCLSETETNVCMWNEYAKGLTGAVIEFNAHKLRQSWPTPIRKMQYGQSEELPRVFDNLRTFAHDVLRGRFAEYTRLAANALALYKTASWKDEREWRATWSQTAHISQPFSLPYPSDSLKSVIFGIKFPTKSFNEAAMLIRTRHPAAYICRADFSSAGAVQIWK